MSLKSLINALFKLSGGQAMPYGTKNSQSVTENNCNDLNTSAPYDGYVIGRFSAVDGVVCRLYRESRAVVSGLGNTGGYVDVSFPVQKGQSITAYANNATTSLTVHFEKIVGGANRLLLQAVQCVRGGAICLKTFSKALSRRCVRSSSQDQRTQITNLQAKRSLLPHRLTVMRCSSHQMCQTLPYLRYSVVTLCRCHRRLLNLGLLSMFHAEKGKQYTQLLTERVDRCCALSGRLFQNNLIATEVCHG